MCREIGLTNPVATSHSLSGSGVFSFAMISNDNMTALVRLYALSLAGGNTKKAEEYIRWVYRANSSETDRFIEQFLSPEEKTEKKKLRAFWEKYRRAKLDEIGIDSKAVERKIVSMDYKEFLETPYWKAIALHVREAAGRTCAICGKKGGVLHVHHKTYKHHGRELEHLEDLVCLCWKCHKEIHKES